MHLQHVVSTQLRFLLRRYAFLRRLSITTTLLTLVWCYTLHWGERSVFEGDINACDWRQWEEWPQEAAPHHLVLIADPQLVDPHTYPGRPWPLSSLTERYTDMYMSRNFRLINTHLDPDSIIFLGDLFDGGREWAPDKPKQLKASQRKKLEDLGILARHQEKRSLESYQAALSKPRANLVTKEEHNIGNDGEDLKAFIPGENGRWSKWRGKQWEKDLERFSEIFFSPEQLYPESARTMFAAYDVPADPINVENGANDVAWQEYATGGDKQRRVITSLPGNHDLGLGAGVQLVVRDRFQSHFGDGNRIDILGNHTFISIDTPSLSAHSQYLGTGFESEAEQFEDLNHIWKPAMDFAEDLRTPAGKLVSEALSEYYPEKRNRVRGWQHEVIEPHEFRRQPSALELAQEALEIKPQLPVILLSHIPLFRYPDTECGRLRERGHAISVQMGYQYQNVLTQSLSKDIVTKVSAAGEIALIFSGDDHDYCDVIHRYNIGTWNGGAVSEEEALKTRLKHIKEITVKSFSWAMGVRKPGFLLVSLWNPVDSHGKTVGTPLPTIQTHLCLLPDQLITFIDYGLLFALTLITLVVRAVVIGLGGIESAEPEDYPPSPTTLTLPRFQLPTANGTANGYANPGAKPTKKGRQRGSSTSMSSHNRSNSNGYLGVQRSYNARTRSVSPSVGAGSGSRQTAGPLIEKAGYFPQVKWTDPADDESDEESNVGGDASLQDDSQAKWKWRRRTPVRARRALDEYGVSLLVVAVPVLLYYLFLIRNG